MKKWLSGMKFSDIAIADRLGLEKTASGHASGSLCSDSRSRLLLERSSKYLGIGMTFLLGLLFLILAPPARSQAWSGILDPSRAIDWTQGGVAFTIPSGSWTQCGTTIAAGASAATINAAIAGCPANHFVHLGTGTFTLSSCIDWAGHSFVALRGDGPLKTIVKFTAGCTGFSGGVNVAMRAAANTYDQAGQNLLGGSNSLVITGTAGTAIGGATGAGLYPQGATQITVLNVGSDAPHVGTMLIIDQANDIAAQSTGWLQCSQNSSAPTCSLNGNNNGRLIGGVLREQIQVVRIASINGSTYTISPGLYANNLRATQSPGAWWNTGSSLCTQCGAESLTFDNSADGAGVVSAINILDCYQCWLKNIRNISGGTRNHIYMIQSSQVVVRDSYFFGSVGNSSGGGYGLDPVESSDGLIENNIWDQLPSPIVGENYSGFVVGYNFSWNNQFVNPNFMQTVVSSHDSGSHMNLYEGNYFNGVSHDTQHGASPTFTYFRNDFPGQQPVPYDKTEQTLSVEQQALQHGESFIGNTFGMITCLGGTFAGRAADKNSQCVGGSATGPSFQVVYEASPNTNTTSNCNAVIFLLGWSSQTSGCSTGGTVSTDTAVATTMMRWGNYDTVTQSVRWNNNEVPTAGTAYLNGNPVPTSHTLPPSFYYNGLPSWWKSTYGTPPWPPIGPDVSGGNLAGLAGHAYENLARLCYENTPQDSTGYPGTAIIAFDANSCFGSTSSSQVVAPSNLITAVN